MWCVIRWAICFKRKERERKPKKLRLNDVTASKVRKEEKANHLVTHGTDDGKYFETAFCSHIDCNDLFVRLACACVCESENATFIALLPQSKSHKLCVLDSPADCMCLCVLSIGNMQRMHCI